ncbi:hypothetical protein ACFL0M_14375, partial [Thermodesulfobacteriota bacterium]
DWVVLMVAAHGINDTNCNPKIREFMELGLKHHPVNGGYHTVGNALTLSWEMLIEGVGKERRVRSGHMVFDSPDNVEGFIRDLVQADLGISVVVSGLHTGIDQICKGAGTRRHTAQYSLGVWGKTEKLPHPKILEITTMCGHAHIPFSLVCRMAKAVQEGTLSMEEASVELGKPCICGAFNTSRAQTLIKEYIAFTTGK